MSTSSSPPNTGAASTSPGTDTPTIFTPPFHPTPSRPEGAGALSTISTLGLLPHVEGGYFVQTDKDPLQIPNPFTTAEDGKVVDHFRNASTTIFYFLTPKSPWGMWHRNKARTVHTLHWGRGRYVTISPEGELETWVVGRDLAKGERVQWIVGGGVWKASWLLDGSGGEEEGLLISETVVPGFEYADHEFMTREKLDEVMGKEKAEELGWLIRSGPPPEEEDLL